MAAAPRLEMEKMSVEQLRALKEQGDLEVNVLQDSLNNIRAANIRLETADAALHDLSLRPPGKKMLVPLTASLYVAGELDDAEKVLVDVGTGYFIESNVSDTLANANAFQNSIDDYDNKESVELKTMAEGKDYCERKIALLKSNYDQLLEVAAKKKSIADEAGAVLQAKVKHLAPSQ